MARKSCVLVDLYAHVWRTAIVTVNANARQIFEFGVITIYYPLSNFLLKFYM